MYDLPIYSPTSPIKISWTPEKKTINVDKDAHPALYQIFNFNIDIKITNIKLTKVMKKPTNVAILKGTIEKFVKTHNQSEISLNIL